MSIKEEAQQLLDVQKHEKLVACSVDILKRIDANIEAIKSLHIILVDLGQGSFKEYDTLFINRNR